MAVFSWDTINNDHARNYRYRERHKPMSRKDQFHQAVKRALEKEGWLITHDPFTIQITEEESKQWTSYKNIDR